jgi:hypothetical protein
MNRAGGPFEYVRGEHGKRDWKPTDAENASMTTSAASSDARPNAVADLLPAGATVALLSLKFDGVFTDTARTD